MGASRSPPPKLAPCPHSSDCGASPTDQLAPSPHPPAAIHQHATRPPPRPPHSCKPAPAADVRIHESPRDARVTQAPAGAIDHGQIRAAVSGQDCGWRTCNARGNCPAQRLGRVGQDAHEKPTRKPKRCRGNGIYICATYSAPCLKIKLLRQ
jgi:hypothetical protein